MSTTKSSIYLDIITQFKNMGAQQAEKSFLGLQGTAAKVAKSIAGLFAVQKMVEFGKASFEAFHKDDLAAKSLSQTLTNLGLSFDDNKTKTFIADMEKTYKVLDEQLRPAMQSLLQVTGSVSKSQAILKSALNLSAGTNTDLATATQALSQAYVGNLKGLKQFNLGLTQAELKSKTFDQILALINAKFKDQALIKAADPMNALAVASENAKEIIGKGLVDALTNMYSAGGKVNDLTTNVNALATAFSNVLRVVGKVGGFISYGIKGLIDSGKQTLNFFKGAGGYGQSGKADFYNSAVAKSAEVARKRQEELRAKAEADALKRNRELAKIIRDQAAAAALIVQKKKEAAILDKASAVLNKISPVFDLTAIETYAAYQQATNEGDKARLQLMLDIQALQRAISAGDATLAAQMANSVKVDLFNLSQLQDGLSNLKGPENPLKSLIDDIYASIAALQALEAQMQRMRIAAGTLYISSTGQSSDTTTGTWGQYYKGLSGGLYGSTPAVVNQTTYNIAGSVVSDQMLSQTLANNNASGINSDINRVNVTYA